MEIKDELPIARASAAASVGGGEPFKPLFTREDFHFLREGSDMFDIQAYAAQYSGRTRVARLLFIAEKSKSEAMQLDALRLAYEASLTGKDTALHRHVCTKINGRLGPCYAVDQAWSDGVDRRSLVLKEQIASDLSGYKTNLIKESIGMGYNDLGDFHYAHGHLPEALDNYIRACDYCSSSKDVVQICMNVILVCIELGQFMHIPTYVSKAEQTPDGLDPVSVAKLRAAAGLAYMEKNEYRLAAYEFIETGSELENKYSEVISPQDVALYGAVCALLSFDRQELKTKIINNSSFRSMLDLVPEVRELVNDFYSRPYNCMWLFDKLTERMLLDLRLNCHFQTLHQHIYHESTKMECEYMALFAEDNLEARIEFHLATAASTNGTLKAEKTWEAIRFGLVLSLAEEALRRSLGEESAINSLRGNEPGLRDQLVRAAFLGLQSNQIEVAMANINYVVVMGPVLSSFERSVFSLSTLRAAIHGKKSIQRLLKGSFQDQTKAEKAMLARYKEKVLTEFGHACLSQIGVIEKYLLPNREGESMVYYLRLKGLVLEVLAQVGSSKMDLYKALNMYMSAVEKAEQQLCPSNPEALHAGFELSLFLQSQMDDLDSAYEAGRKALDKAYPILEASHRDPDLQPSRYLFMMLARHVSNLAKLIAGEEALVPYGLWFTDHQDSNCSPLPEFRQCKSCGLDTSVVKLSKTNLHPKPDAAYKVIMDEDDDADDHIYLRSAEVHIVP